MAEMMIPNGDWVLLEKLDHEERTSSGLILPEAGKDYDSLKTDRERDNYRPDRDLKKNTSRGTNRYKVLAVGPGMYVDIADDVHDQVFIRKPMCCAEGDIVLVQEGAFPLPVDGRVLHMAHEYCILAILGKADTGRETVSPTLDYIFSRPAAAIRKSTGGLYLPDIEDGTGTKALPDRWEAVYVGPGPWALASQKGKAPEFRRRPMPVEIGEVFCYEGAGFLVTVAGAQYLVCQAYQVAGRFVHA